MMNDIVFLGDNRFETKVAVSYDEQAKGLMFVPWPPPVMSFPVSKPTIKKFWMKNTVSPLDIVFCSDNTVIGIYKGEPLSTALIGPDRPVDLVVELPAGTAAQRGIKVGDPVRLKLSSKTASRFISERLQYG